MPENRILTSHVGSLVRPPEFAALLKEKAAGRPVPDFDQALAAAVRKVVQRQVKAGIDIVSDGEFGKGIGWEQYVIERMTGFSEPKAEPTTDSEPPLPPWGDFAKFADFYGEIWDKERYEEKPFPCTGAITYTGQAALQRDITNLKSAVAAAGAHSGFLPVVAPASATAMSPNEFYKSAASWQILKLWGAPRNRLILCCAHTCTYQQFLKNITCHLPASRVCGASAINLYRADIHTIERSITIALTT